MTPKLDQTTLNKRLDTLQPVLVAAVKKLVLIRPCIPGDNYTQLGSNVWADLVRQKANVEGWQVVDLSANGATRAQIETNINSVKPHLIIHYDHGSNFTLYGQDANVSVPGLDEANINLATGRFVSTVSCLSASGLGPAAISDGITTYLGYTDLHYFVIGYQDRFGQAANAVNYALLEGKTAQQAFDIGWQAYDDLYDQLLAGTSYEANIVAPYALHDRDCFALLGSTTARAIPQTSLCKWAIPSAIHYCKIGQPDLVIRCKIGQPNSAIHCKIGLPDSMIHCKINAPDIIILDCTIGQPDHMLSACSELPDMNICGHGPDMCTSGPPVRIRDIYDEITHDRVIIDMDKVPPNIRKSLQALLDRMQTEK